MAQVTIDVYGELMTFERGPMHEVTQDEYVIRACANHGGKYTYGTYLGMKNPIDVKCPEHGWFKVSRANNHLHRDHGVPNSGCPVCHREWLLNRLHEYSESKEIQDKKSATRRHNLEAKIGMPFEEYRANRRREWARLHSRGRKR
jgi:hypothetical protein